MRRTVSSAAFGTLGAAALVLSASGPPAAAPPGTREPSPFDAAVVAAAAEFRRWPRVSDRANWAPIDCRITAPAGVQRSDSRDEPTHGRKLYFLYARDDKAYHAPAWLDHAPTAADIARIARDNIGQTLVKESFVPREVAQHEVPTLDPSTPFEPRHPGEYEQHGGKWFTTGDPAGLFIMLKLDPKTEGTDEGWVYATTSADGRTIIEAGRIASCMECHAAEHGTIDRVFGSARTRERLAHYRRVDSGK